MGYYDDDDKNLTEAQKEARNKDPVYEAISIIRFFAWMFGSWKRVVGVLVLLGVLAGGIYFMWYRYGREQPPATFAHPRK